MMGSEQEIIQSDVIKSIYFKIQLIRPNLILKWNEILKCFEIVLFLVTYLWDT